MRGFWGLTSGVRLQSCGSILPGLFRVGLLTIAGIVVLAALPGCGTIREGAAPGGDAVAGTQVVLVSSPEGEGTATATTSPEVVATPQGVVSTATAEASPRAGEATATATASPEVSYPRSVSAEDLKGLCKYSGELGSSSTVIRTKYYEEVDGRFEFVREDMSIGSIDANLNMNWVSMDANGVKYSETYYVDGFTYYSVSEDEADGWRVEASPGFWDYLIPDSDDPVGPTGRVIDLPDGSDTVCEHSPEDLEDVTDYGMEMLDGVRVRHVGANLKPHLFHRAWTQMIVEYWVDSDGQLVQTKDTEIGASSGEYPASRSEAVSTFIDRDPSILITAPAGAATPAAGP